MKDRQPTNAGRVQLVPVAGQTNIYDMTMADGATEQGTPLCKATFLKDATAALYGLTNTAVPDDVFAWLGKYNEHCWKRRWYGYIEKKEDTTTSVNFGRPGTLPTKYSTEIEISNAGEISLKNPQETLSNSGSSVCETLINNAPCYFSINGGIPPYYLPEGSDYGFNDSNKTLRYYNNDIYANNTAPVKLQKVTAEQGYGEWELVYSTNRSAYPDSGIQDGYEYEYIGVPFDNLTKDHVKIETGSFVGTGTYGASNPNSLTFGFVPKLLIVSLAYKNTSTPRETQIGGYAFYVSYNSVVEKSGDATYPAKIIGTASGASFVLSCSLSNNNKTISWYSTESAVKQLNPTNGTTYYIAIG